MKTCQKGSVLIFSLITLAVLLFSITSLVYTASTATVVSGNFNFKNNAVKEADYGLYSAVKSLVPCGTEPCSKISDDSYIYFEEQDEDTLLNASTWNNSNAYVHTISDESDNYQVSYIIDRLSNATLDDDTNDADKVEQNSYGLILEDTQGSNDATDGSNVIKLPIIFYRVTIRVEGPSNTLYMTQAIVTVEE